MFGIKEKVKEQVVPPVEETEKEIENEEVLQEEVQDVVEETIKENATPVNLEKKDAFDLAYLLGKTESGLKSEFYAYQIKELMKSIGVTLKRTEGTSEQFEEVYKQAIKYGADEICVSPYYYQACKNIEEKLKGQEIKIGAMIDYPYGESSFKARLADVKVAVQNGVNLITVVFPVSATVLGSFGGEKAKLNKICKAGKSKVGVAIKADLGQEDLKRIVKLVDGTKCSHITLLAENLGVEKIIDAIQSVSLKKGNKKIHVYTAIDKMQDLSAVLEQKVDKVYTPYLDQIGEALSEKFGIEM